MPRTSTFVMTSLAMLAFACNSLLCRTALQHTSIDAASFTSIRLASGAATLWLIAIALRPRAAGIGSWPSAVALFVYAAGFSFAYRSLPASTGALLLFGAVQATMIGRSLWAGERMRSVQVFGVLFAFGGLVGLFFPGLTAPPLVGSLLMVSAGVAWGVYSLRGQRAGDPTRVTAGNFLRAAPIAAAVSLMLHSQASIDGAGFGYAVASGALASGIGYAIWYAALRSLNFAGAATVQLSVPVIAAVGGIVLLDEPLTLRLVLASLAILGGIALVTLGRSPRSAREGPANERAESSRSGFGRRPA